MTWPPSPLQLGAIAAGILVVVAVIVYNWWVERRVRRRIEATFRKPAPAVAAGGGTRFKLIGKTFQPEQGTMLSWLNVHEDGSPNPATLHQGMKVRAGTKYILTKLFREHPVRSTA